MNKQPRQLIVCRDGRVRNVSKKRDALQFSDSFWSRVNKTETCWCWNGARSGNGYGSVWDGAKVENAHVLAWRLIYGSIPKGQQVLHRCDNPPCVRPDHLFLGTQKQNIQDMLRKNRRHDSSGEKCSNAKLDATQVAEIRKRKQSGESGLALAKDFHVTHSTIYALCNGKTWNLSK